MRVGRALLTDLYELNMAASYVRRGMTAPATFSLFVRSLPPQRGFLVAAGLEECLRWLEELSFSGEDLDYLASVGMNEDSLVALAPLHFTGDVRAVPEGRVVLAGEPLLEVTAPIAEAQLAETFLLNQVTFQTTLASKAARCRLAAAGRIEVVEFGFRRTQGVEAGIAAARVAAMVGFRATSNVAAARRFSLEPSGTMAHSYVEAFPTELEAFRAFASDLPGRTTFLVDTYDTLSGVQHAMEVARELGIERQLAVRLDSGDLIGLSIAARRMLDEGGLPEARIFVSGGLDEHDLARLVAAGAPVDAAGVGTRLGVSADAPYLDSAYKLVAYDGRPVMKLSEGKATLPGAKQVFRGPGLADWLAMADEAAPPGTRPVLELVMRAGSRLPMAGPQDDEPALLDAARARFEADLGELPALATALTDPVPPEARLTPALERLDAQVRASYVDERRAEPAGDPSARQDSRPW
jgi:nicotinate phosphoribosyltransferase